MQCEPGVSAANGGNAAPETPRPQSIEKPRRSLHLVGSHLIETENLALCALSASRESGHFSYDALRRIASEYQQQVRKHVMEVVSLDPEFITGQLVLERILRERPELRQIPIVNMAPDTFRLSAALGGINAGVERLCNPETVEWSAPVAQIESSRVRFYGFAGDARVGTCGRDRPRSAAVNAAIALFKERLTAGIILMDDRGSAECSTLNELAKEFFLRNVEVSAYIVGHSARTQFGDAGHTEPDRATCSIKRGRQIEVPVYAHTFRYLDPDKQRHERGQPAAELCELGYFQGAGYSIVKGYLEAYPFLKPAFRELQHILSAEMLSYDTASFASLEGAGVRVLDSQRLADFFQQKAHYGKRLTLQDFRALFAKRQGATILELKNAPEFNPDEMDNRRVPVLWPGIPENSSFLTLLTVEKDEPNYTKWYEFSKRMLATTIAHLENLQRLTGKHLPKAVLGFMGVPRIMQRFSDKTRQSPDAIDYASELLKMITAEQRLRGARTRDCVRMTDSGAISSWEVEEGRGDSGHPTLPRWY